MNDILDRAGETVGEFMPRLGGALLLLIGGLLVVRIFTRLLVKALLRAKADKLADRLRINDALGRAGLERSFTRLLGAVLRFGLSVVVVLAALSLLGLQVISDAVNETVLFLPQLLLALLFVLAGAVLSDVAKERADRLAYQMALRAALGQAVRVVVLAIFGILALGQIGVPTEILVSLATVVVAGGVAAFALAFGLGGRLIAEQLTVGRFLGGVYRPGDMVVIDDLRCEIVRLETAAAVVETDDGRTVRIANERLLRADVTIAERDPHERFDDSSAS